LAAQPKTGAVNDDRRLQAARLQLIGELIRRAVACEIQRNDGGPGATSGRDSVGNRFEPFLLACNQNDFMIVLGEYVGKSRANSGRRTCNQGHRLQTFHQPNPLRT
jgi:hypothetical protein